MERESQQIDTLTKYLIEKYIIVQITYFVNP